MINNILQEQITSRENSRLTLAQLRNAGLSATAVGRAVKRGELLRVAHGVYQSPEYTKYLDDEMFGVQLQNSHIIYSHDTALFYMA